MDLANKAVLLTGASSGIGLASARLLAEKGARLALAARSEARLRQIASELGNATPIPADITNAASAESLVRKAHDNLGGIDVLINCAGRTMFAPVESLDIDVYRELLELNVVGPLRLMQLVIPHMRKAGGGTILNVSSMVTRAHIPGIAGYSSTKYALNSLSLTAQIELAEAGIRVAVFRPGLVDTDFGNNTALPEPDYLRRGEDGALKSYVHSADSVAARLVQMLEADETDVDMPNPH